MTAQVARKYVKVWVKKRKNNARKGGRAPTTSSYTLQWPSPGRRAGANGSRSTTSSGS